METLELRANGLDFGAIRHGDDGDRRALLLHGFPDDPRSMQPLMERLADAGFQTVAPWMRGYGPTDLPPEGDYRITSLAADAVGLMDALDWERPLLVGHDWGAVAGYAAANLAPHRISTLVAMSVPPPRIFLKNLFAHPAQLRRSWYIAFFQLAGLPEWWLERRDFAVLDSIWTETLEEIGQTDSHLEHVRETFRAPGTLEAALGYYRQLVPRSLDELGDYRRCWQLAMDRIERPTLMIAGDRDPAIGAETFEAHAPAFDAPHDLVLLFGAGHFVQLEAPDEIARSIVEFSG